MAKAKKKTKAKRSNSPMVRQRRVPQHEQEKLSRHQLAICWKEWSLQSSAEDLGEDLLVQIYAEGRSTGLAFYVQLKSTTDMDGLVSKKNGKFIEYRVATKDLLHWENSLPPVVLTIWDVQKNRGLWQDIPSALKALDGADPKWRTRQTAAVQIPRAHRTDAKGRDTLRVAVAHLAMPMLSAGKEIKIKHTFSFPKTPEGRAALKELRRATNEGGSVTVPGKFIKEFRASEWWERAYGARIPEFVTLSSSGEPLSLPVEIQVVGAQRTESLSVLLQRTLHGENQVTFEAAANRGPVSMTLVLKKAPGQQLAISVRMNFQQPCTTVHDSLAVTKLLVGIRQGGVLQLVLPGRAPIPQPTFAMTGGKTLDDLLAWERVLQVLNYIQTRVASFGSFDVERLKKGDVETIQQLALVLQKGQISSTVDLTLPKPLKGRVKELRGDGGTVELLGVKIPLGEVRIKLQKPDAFADAAKQASASKSRRGPLALVDVPVVQRYVDWGPGRHGPGTGANSSVAPRVRQPSLKKNEKKETSHGRSAAAGVGRAKRKKNGKARWTRHGAQ